MDDYAQYLQEEARSSVAALHLFNLLYDPHRDDYHFFFEGEDDFLFYMPDARRRIGTKQVHMYDCGNKYNVIEVRDSIKQACYDVAKCLFFVDRDYDDLLGCQVTLDEHTYITDSYSIENEIPNKNCLEIIMSDILRISRADPEFRRIENFVSINMTKFYRKILPLSAWIIAAEATGCCPNLRNTKGLEGVVTMSSLGPVFTKTGFSKFKKKVIVNRQHPPIGNVIRCARALDTTQAKAWVRGKYDIWFFKIMLIAAIEKTNSTRSAAGGRTVRIPGFIRAGRFFEALGGRVPVPASLHEFYVRKLH